MLLAVDPGPTESAWVLYNGDLFNHGISKNEDLLRRILWEAEWQLANLTGFGEWMVIEKVVSYGRPVGASTFETVYWTGVFCQAFGRERTSRIERRHVKKHICPPTPEAPISTVKDGMIRNALIDRWYQSTGNEKPHRKGGPLYKLTMHGFQALALAIYWDECERPWIPREKLPQSMREKVHV